MEANYFERMMASAINSMRSNNHEWPDHWDKEKKELFLNQCLEWFEEKELYECCEVVLNEKKKIKK